MLNEKGIAETQIDFKQQTNYRIGTVTYMITAHYKKDADFIQNKIQKLIKKDIESDDLEHGLNQKNVV